MSDRVICIVQARMGSSRLPGKVLADLAGRPLLEFMLARLESLDAGPVIVATTTLERDEPVVELASGLGAKVVRGPEDDVLGRFSRVLDHFPAEHVVRLTADCPLIDPGVVGEVVDAHVRSEADYTSNVLPRTFPRGLDVEVARAASLQVAHRRARDPVEREHVTPFLYRHPEQFRLANVRSGGLHGRQRWTVDTEDDLAFMRSLVDRLPRPDVAWNEILHLAGSRSEDVAIDRVALRPVLREDSERLLAWRNDERAVRFSGSGSVVSPDRHQRWFESKFDDPSTRIWIAEFDHRPVGMVRTDVRNATGEVSLGLDADFRGQGLGWRILRLLQHEVRAEHQVVTLTAKVHEQNAASLRTFERVGFARSAREGDFTVYRWDRTQVRGRPTPRVRVRLITRRSE